MTVTPIKKTQQMTNGCCTSCVNRDNPFLYAASQTMAALAGAGSARLSLIEWSALERNMQARVRADVESYTGTYHGQVIVQLYVQSRAFSPDAEPAGMQHGVPARGCARSMARPNDNPFIYAAFQTMSELTGAPDASTLGYELLDWRGNEWGSVATVRVDGDTSSGCYHGTVSVRLQKAASYFKPDATLPDDAFVGCLS